MAERLPTVEPDSALAPIILARRDREIAPHERYVLGVLDGLPAAIYATDAAGRITYYNEAAALLWGQRPELGESQWCGSWKLFWPDGRPMEHGECPMATAIRERRPIRGLEGIVERPDGTRVPFMPYPTPLFDVSGNLIGAVNMMMDITDRKRSEADVQRLAAIVASSEDAIISKDLDGIILTWNKAAERLFGYTPQEVIGRSVTMLIPSDHLDEEPEILARIRRGDHVEHYETVRRHKDGSLIDISLTVSPIKNAAGKIIGASKIARDITDRRRTQAQQNLLLREMNHRVKNLFTLASSVVTLSARSASSVSELASAVRDRLTALARAHELTLPKSNGDVSYTVPSTTLHALIKTIVSPYDGGEDQPSRVTISGPDVPLATGSVTSLALLLHEFATNAAKYGALSVPTGFVEVQCHEKDDRFLLIWRERGGPTLGRPVESEGFGSLLTRLTVQGQLDGDIAREWNADGLTIRLSVSRNRLVG